MDKEIRKVRVLDANGGQIRTIDMTAGSAAVEGPVATADGVGPVDPDNPSIGWTKATC